MAPNRTGTRLKHGVMVLLRNCLQKSCLGEEGDTSKVENNCNFAETEEEERVEESNEYFLRSVNCYDNRFKNVTNKSK